MSTKETRIILKTFIESQFGYFSLVWMLHSITLNNKINHLHERAVQVVFRNYDCSYKDLFKMNQSFTVQKHTIFSHLIIQGQAEHLNTHDGQSVPDDR